MLKTLNSPCRNCVTLGVAMTVQKGKAVSIFFSLKVERDKKLIASRQQKPLNFVVGEKKLMLGLDKELIGLEMGEKKKIKISPENGYGFRKETLVLSVNRSRLPEHIKVREGLTLKRKTKTGKVMKGLVSSFDDQTVIVDFNHPFAGETLLFETEIIDVRDAAQL
jgi:FKBP-type peptidyl-prolyl cis-trans isomerase 2